jgi:hypothetical protein
VLATYEAWNLTVSSAYNLARSKKFFGNLSRSGRRLSSFWEADERAWKALWKIKAPGKNEYSFVAFFA